ncbi:MAG TPA: YhdH/YhfP family quinone oxidoreductase [Patescibacteria group bacterium]|nr:YhdH/YhfP family quinone oxidoreductase [Patescibacteria group bacterium]
MTLPDRFRAYRIHAEGKSARGRIDDVTLDDLQPGEVVIKTAYSSVNYKDALAGSGQGRILRRYPLVGGIDVAGHVVQSSDPSFREGDAVLVTGCGLSETRDGGYSEFARIESRWAIPLPSGLSLREAMILGTAGFTAALSLYRMEANGQSPDMGPIVVTGATGGVGMLAIDLLATAGYEVHAISGKPDQFDALIALGAKQCIARHHLDLGQRPLETARWAGAIDNVGGDMLAALTRVIQPYGNIASCGLAASAELHTTVMPFIIRGVSVLGIASAGTAFTLRRTLWERLASMWKPKHLETILTKSVNLDELDVVFARMLSGGSFGRTLVQF